MLRGFLERSTKTLRVKRRLPAAFNRVPLWVSPSAGLRFLFRGMADADPALFNFALEFVAPRAVVWDVGANVGLFSFAAAAKAGPGGVVVSLEPDAFLVQLLRRSARIQPPASAPVQVVPAAVARSVGLRKFSLAPRARQANFLDGYGTTQARGPLEEQTVVTVTLDWLAERVALPDVLKIDVEGAELEVLEGARSVLERKRPVILCEVGSAASADVTAFLAAFGYRILNGELPPAQRETLRSAPWCTLAVPS